MWAFPCRHHDHEHYHDDDEYHITPRDIALGFLTFMIILTNLQVRMPSLGTILGIVPITLWLHMYEKQTVVLHHCSQIYSLTQYRSEREDLFACFIV
jgi:hypothetical protein